MTMAAAIESRTAEAAAWSKSGRIASVDIIGDLGQAEDDHGQAPSVAGVSGAKVMARPE